MQLKINNLSFSYNNKEFFYYPDFIFNKGLTIISAPSGKGKSTFFLLLMRELIPKTGIIEWNGKNINNFLKFEFLETVITIVFQNAVISYYFNLKEYIDLLILNRGDYIRDLSTFYVNILNLSHLLYENIAYCSGGEKYKISLLLALLKNTSLLLLDEPTAHLDKNNSVIVLNILKNINDKVIIISSHDQLFLDEQKNFSFYYL